MLVGEVDRVMEIERKNVDLLINLPGPAILEQDAIRENILPQPPRIPKLQRSDPL